LSNKTPAWIRTRGSQATRWAAAAEAYERGAYTVTFAVRFAGLSWEPVTASSTGVLPRAADVPSPCALTGHLGDSQHVHHGRASWDTATGIPANAYPSVEADAAARTPRGCGGRHPRRPGAPHSVAGGRCSFSQAGKSFRLRSTTSAPAALSSSAEAGPVATVTDRARAARAASTSAGWSPT
jgi:hypothetical protein